MYKIFFFILIALQITTASSQSFWKIENEYGDQILLSLILNEEKETFVAQSRKDALKDIAGSITFALAKTAGKLKYAEIVFIEGSTQKKEDLLMLSGIFYYFEKQFRFEASVSEDSFNGRYIDNKNKAHPLKGIKVQDKKPIRDYPAIVDNAISLTEKYIFNSVWIQSDEWSDFKKKINELKMKISDDYEIVASFYWLRKNLPFSPYEISKINPSSIKLSRGGRNVRIRELNPVTAFVGANNLPASVNEMDSLALLIGKKGYSNLIIDLRGKNKILPEETEILLNYLSVRPFQAGVYLTRKWFDFNNTIPKSRDYSKFFRSFSDNKYTSGEIYREAGQYLNIMPRAKTFKGKVFILTDAKTSGVSESLIYILKNQKIATIVGQKTSGSSFHAVKFIVNNEFSLNLLVSDYFTPEGKNLSGIGIEPDIKVSGEDALEYVLKRSIFIK